MEYPSRKPGGYAGVIPWIFIELHLFTIWCRLDIINNKLPRPNTVHRVQGLSDHYTIGEVAKISGVSRRMLDNWATSRFLVPSIRTGHGSGTRRLYNFSDIVAARVAKDLRKVGIPLQSLRVVIRRLQKEEYTIGANASALTGVRLLVSGKDVLIANGQEEYISLLEKPGQMHLPFFVADLSVVTTLAVHACAVRAAA